MHVSKTVLAGLLVLASHASARYIGSNQQTSFGRPAPAQTRGQSAVQERDGLSDRVIFSEAPEDPAPEIICDGTEISCTSMTPELDLVANVDHKGGPYTSYPVIPPTATDLGESAPKGTEFITRRDDEQETVYVWGPTRWTIEAKRTPAVAKRDGQDPVTHYIYGEPKASVARASPSDPTHYVVQATYVTNKKSHSIQTAAPEVPQDPTHYVIEATYVTNDKRSRNVQTAAPEVPKDPTHYVIEATYVTDDKKRNITPTIASKPHADRGSRALPEVAQKNVGIPTDAPQAINASGGRVKPTVLASQPPETLQQQVRRQRASDPVFDTRSADNTPGPDTSTPLRCYEWARRGTEGATAVCAFGSLNDPRVHLATDHTEFLALGKHGEYVCAPSSKYDAGGMIECRDRCAECGGVGSGMGGLTCKERCGWVDKRGEEKMVDDQFGYVFAGTSEDGLEGFWCPEEMVVKDEICIWVAPGQE